MVMQPSEEQGNWKEPAATDIESVYASGGSAFSQSGGASENSKVEVDGPYYRPLLQAAFRGDWEFATGFFERDAASKMAKITSRSETLLHLVELLSPYPEALEMVDCDGRTALHNAVLCGRIRMVKTLIRSNPRLTQLADKDGRVPLGISALEASMHKEIARLLAKSMTNDGPGRPFSSSNAMDTIIALTYHGNHGIPVGLNYKPTNKNSDPVPIIKRIHEVKLRHMMAIELAKQVCDAFSHGKTAEIIDFFETKSLLIEATTRGITEIVKLCIQFFPEFICIRPYSKRLQTKAVKYRQERILRLFLTVSSNNKLSLVLGSMVEESMEMMEAAADEVVMEDYPNFNVVPTVAGAAFHMQRELQWYKAVESWVVPYEVFAYHDEKTYWNKFLDKHKELIEQGEKWVKDTANSCMLISTLITTVLFVAPFTMPRGYDGKTRVPILLGQDYFHIFAISDVLGLFSSKMAILLFLAILTSRYEAQDFLNSLPKKIIMGLSLLFLALAFMLAAFVATLAMVLDKRLKWALIPVTLLASVLVALFVVLQLPLLFQMVKSTYGPNIFRP